MSDALPDHWYKYDFPLTNDKPVPSQANYDPKNVAWLIEQMAQVLGQNHTDLRFRYENNTPDKPYDDIYVEHPNDRLYLWEKARCDTTDNPDMMRYERRAKQSTRLRIFEENSPAEIEYFKDIRCRALVQTFVLKPINIVESQGFLGFVGEEQRGVDVRHVNDPVALNALNNSCVSSMGSPSSQVTFEFEDLPEGAPEEYNSVAVKFLDKAQLGTGTSGGATLKLHGMPAKTHYYNLTAGYTFQQKLWAGRFTKNSINGLQVVYHNGLNPLTAPIKQLTALEVVVQAAF
jgi:hypothetical protein